jgi:hypothetical protein
LKKTVGIHCHLLNINSKPRKETQLQQDLLDEDDGGVLADESVRQIWERVLPESDRIESEIQKEASADNQLIQTGTASPAHRRSSSITSNMSSLPSGLMHVSSVQSLPINAETQEEQADSLQEPVQPRPIVQYGRYMTEQDVQGIKNMVRDFTVQSMLPFMERSIQHWNEQVAAARRGLAGRLMGASRRFFGTNTRSPSPQSVQTISAQGPNVPVGVNTLTIYPFAAPEAQMRKLADYAFMLRDYKFAYTIYETVRRDFATEKAYKHHAATQEMMGVCLLLMNAPLQNKKDVDSHFELAVQQYLGRCRSPFHATRTTIIYYELLKACRMWNDIPTALVRMTGEDSDLRSGLFLEQAAHCFLRVSKPRVRKYGFHLMMAGHRYGKASQVRE